MLLKTLAFLFVTSSVFTEKVKRSWDTSIWTENCSLPPEPEHGSYEVVDSTVDSYGEGWPTKVVFMCWSGYTLDGAQTAVCINGRWSNQIPRCQAQRTQGGNSKEFSYKTSWSTQFYKEFPPQFTYQSSQPQHLLSQLEQITSQQQQNIPQQQQFVPQQQQYVPQQQPYIPQQQQYVPQQQQNLPQQQPNIPQQQQIIPQQQQNIPQQQPNIPQQQQSIAQPQQLLSELEGIISQQRQLGPEERNRILSQLQQLKLQQQQPIPQQQQQCTPQQQQLKKQQQKPLKKGVQLKQISVRTGGCILPPYPEFASYKLTTVMSPVSSSHRLTTNLTFSCDFYHILEGPRSIICIDGRWSDNSPYCRDRTPEEGAVSAGGVGGKDAKERELPWHVGIYDKSNTPYDQICGGTIVSRNRVISAAHCFWDDLEKLRSASQFAVGAGKLYRAWDETLDKDNAQKSDVTNIRIPPRYQHSATNFQEDIAMLTLSTAFTFNGFVRAAVLDFNPMSDARHLREGNLAKVGGWGLITEDGMQATKLQVLQLPYVAIEKCITENEPNFLNYITADKICAGYRNGTALCMGDSGGGLIFSETRDGNQRNYLRGIVSTAPTGDNACNIYAWTTFTHVLRQEHFIKQ